MSTIGSSLNRTNSTESIAMLQRLRVALEDDEPLPGDARRWLRDGLRQYARGAPSLDDALGLRVGPGEAWRKPSRVMWRDHVEKRIVEAAKSIEGTDNQRAARIAQHVSGEATLPADAQRIVAEVIDDMPASRSAILRILQRRCARNTDYSHTARLLAQWRP